MKYQITIEETISQNFEIEADNLEEAKNIAIFNYENTIFVLESGNLICVDLLVENDKESSGWFEL